MSVLKYYNGNNWEVVGGMGLPQIPISFSSYLNVDTTISTSSNKVIFNAEEFDNGSCYDTTTGKFTCQKTGLYYFTSLITFNSDSGISILSLYKNGTEFKKGNWIWNTTMRSVEINCLVSLVVGDYVELYISNSSGSNKTAIGNNKESYFQGCLIPDSSQQYSYPQDFTGVSTDRYLEIGQSIYIVYTNSTSVPLHIQSVEGIYEMIICGDRTLSTGSDTDSYLMPNNINITPLQRYKYSNTSSGSVIMFSGNGPSNTGLTLGGGLIYSYKGTISTYTKNKQIDMNSYMKQATVEYLKYGNMIWNDTTTVWSSLGTISFSVAQSGKILIKRIL